MRIWHHAGAREAGGGATTARRFQHEIASYLLDRHLGRLGASAAHFGFDADLDEVRRRIEGVTAEEPRCLRVLVGADGATEVIVPNMDRAEHEGLLRSAEVLEGAWRELT